MTRSKSIHQRSAYTITETVIAIAITTVMVGLVLPGVQRARETSRRTQGLINLQEIGQGMYVYSVDNYGTLPLGYDRDAAIGSSPGAGETGWEVTVNGYLTGEGGSNYMSLALTSQNQMLPMFKDPNATFPNDGLSHYTGNPGLLPDDNFLPAYKLSRFRRPQEVVFIMDGIQRLNSRGGAPFIVNHPTFATALDLDGGSMKFFPTQIPDTYTYNPSQFANQTTAFLNLAIATGTNQDGVVDESNIRWRQNRNRAANVLYPDGHTETKSTGAGNDPIRKRHILVDP